MDFYILNINILSGFESNWINCKKEDLEIINDVLIVKNHKYPISLIIGIDIRIKLFNHQKQTYILKINSNVFIDKLSNKAKHELNKYKLK